MNPQDHREIGRRLDLFHFQEEAPGMVFWHPRGLSLMRQLEELVRTRIQSDDFHEVRSPQLLRKKIWEASGHWQSFRDEMFVLGDADGAHAAIKPVSCPGHLELARRMSLSYRDLPYRIAELGLCHRNENSGSLHGLFRLRQFTQDDGHILLEDTQVASEVARFWHSLQALLAVLGMGVPEVSLSLRPAIRHGDDALWDRAESRLAQAADAAGIGYERVVGGGAFYGPKLEFSLRDHLGKPWQCGTIQLDLVLPGRFDVWYADADGARKNPVLLHRALLGSLERFMGLLLEQSRGLLPAWLAPEQVLVLPVAPEHESYAREVLALLRQCGLRARADYRSDSLARRVVGAHERGIPYVVVLGDRELRARSLNLRSLDSQGRELELSRACDELVVACARAA
jgi:threonyl-tRNA synthetase